MIGLLRRPSAFLPLAMSATVLAFIIAQLLQSGTVRASDENAGAHLFQILTPLQLPIIAFFALRWLPQRRDPALKVLALQCTAVLAIFAIVFSLHW